jgi:hypothetical protein
VITIESGSNIEGDWAGSCVFEGEDALNAPTPVELSFVSPTPGRGRFIGEVENSESKSHALVCGNQLGRTLRFSGYFRGDDTDDDSRYAEFIAYVSDDGLALRGTLRQQVVTDGELIRLAQGTWHARRVTPCLSVIVAEAARAFELESMATLK